MSKKSHSSLFPILSQVSILLVFLRFCLQLDSIWYDFGIICTVIENWWVEV